ncbi:MAG: lysoplasmalogenase family protein [Sphaerochaetaceae bacterium]|jgi:uncharacterized membrane protein YhhN
MPYAVPTIAAVLFLVVSVVHVLTKFRKGGRQLAFITKLLLMPLLLTTFLTAVSAAGGEVPHVPLIVLALVCYTAGDILLALQDDAQSRKFLAGMGSFMAGHICYMVWFLTFAQWRSLAWQAMGIVALCAMAVLFVFCRKIAASGEPHGPGMCAYAALLGVFSVCIAASWGAGPVPGTIVALAGAACFMVSDSIIASDRIGRAVAGEATIMVTYIIANILLLAGVWILTRTPTIYVLLS